MTINITFTISLITKKKGIFKEIVILAKRNGNECKKKDVMFLSFYHRALDIYIEKLCFL